MAAQCRASRVGLLQFDRNSLPAFDAYIYMAMADRPAFFTVGPWGYRLLTPILVRLWPARSDHAYRQLTLSALGVSGVLLFLLLRRLGHGLVGCLAAVAAFGLSAPVAHSAANPFLTEPVSVLLEIGFLLALETGAGLGILALLLLLATLNKELLLVLLAPVVFFARRPSLGEREALGACAAAAAPAIALSLLLRWGWTPHLHARVAAPGPHTLAFAAQHLGGSAGQAVYALLLGGMAPLAVVGARRAASRPYLQRYGWLLLSSVVLPFVAWAAAPGTAKVFFAASLVRLLIYALAPLLPLSLAALGSVPVPSPSASVRRGWAGGVAMALAGALALAGPWSLDRYRRFDLSGVRDGPLVLVLCRESVRMAQQLDEGKPVSWAPAELGYLESAAEYHEIKRLRWFLLDGWGPFPQSGYGPVAMRAGSASLLLPCFARNDLGLTLALSAPHPNGIWVEVNGTPVGEVGVRAEPSPVRLRVPRSALFRGDNRMVLHQASPAVPGPVLDRITIEPLPNR